MARILHSAPVSFAGVEFRGLLREDLMKPAAVLKHIITVNAEAIVMANEDKNYRQILNSNICCFDGQLTFWLARWRNSEHSFEKLSGSDLIYDFADVAKRSRQRIFLLGGGESANSIAQAKLAKLFEIDVGGFAPPNYDFPFPPSIHNDIFNALECYRPEILLVAFGMPKQELWISENYCRLQHIGIKWAIGVGGSFEFVAGREHRAPRFIQRCGLEGVWRLIQKPSRWRRFLRCLRVFLYAWH